MEKQAILSVKDLQVSYGRTHVVNKISFEIFPGETVALVGESGSGKSTAAQAILRLLPSRSSCAGSILFEEKNLLNPKTRMQSIRGLKIGMIFQDPLSSLNPTMKIGKQIAEAIQAHQTISSSELKDAVISLLEQVGIPDPHLRYNQYPYELSGGMRQRVLISIAIACKPALLIADEPTTALDATIQRQILDLLKQLQEDLNMALLLITHDLGIVAGYADRVMVMKNGNIVESAHVDELFYHPKNPYTQLLLSSSKRFL